MEAERLPVRAFEARALVSELQSTVEENLDRHLAAAEDWMPHEYVPWREGRNFALLDGEPWSVEQSRLSPTARAALELNLLTEENLPSYHRELDHTFGRSGAWGAWVNRWTAEEGRHAYCIRDYLLVTRGVDPERLERARMATVQAGFDSGSRPFLNACAYVSFQELATRVAHRNTGRGSGDPIAEKLLARIAMDENLHMIFYRNIVKAAQIASAGIYDLRIHHDDVIMPLLRHWQVFEIKDLDEQGEQAREDLAAALGILDARATRFAERRAMAETGDTSARAGG